MAPLMEEIKAGGVKGILGIDSMDWGAGRGDKTFDCFKCEPCCGSPCNVKDGCYCLVLTWCCGVCTSSKLYASSLNQDCAIFPHCLMAWCCGWCTACFTRYNLRKKHGVAGNICGDCMCLWCCGACTYCQMLRASQKSDWDFVSGFKLLPKFPGELKFIN